MRQFPSGGLNEAEMIDHIKFIAQGLFQTDAYVSPTKNTRSPAKAFSPSKNYSTAHQRNRQYTSPDESYECFHRVKSRMKESETEPRAEKRQKKRPIFQTFEDFVRDRERRGAGKQERPIVDKINKTVYQTLKDEGRGHRQVMGKRKPSREEKEEIWQKFLKRESDWLEDKKRTFQQVKLAEEARRSSSRSPSRRIGSESRRRDQPRGEMGEVEEGIRALKEQTEKLKMRILRMQVEESGKKEGQGLVKTFWYGHHGS